jgi:hypothetical protein
MFRRVDAQPHHLKMFRATRRRDAAEMPEALERQFSSPFEHPLVLLEPFQRADMMPCSMVSVVFQPVARTFFVSRKMNGLSPTQPLLPPEYSSFG